MVQNLMNPTKIRHYLSTYELQISIILIMLTNVLTLGRFTPYLGIYYDEYMTFYVLERFGLPQLLDLAGGQARQLAAVLIALANSNATIGHMLMFIFTTVCALLLMYLLRRVFPHLPLISTLFGLLYLVYPVYFARVYLTILSVDGSLLLALSSFCLSYLALRRKGLQRWVLIGLSLILIPVYVNLYEMPIALEILRPFIIWAALRGNSERSKPPLTQTILWSSLWVTVVGATIFYRLFIFEAYGFYAEIQYNTGLITPPTITEITQIIKFSLMGLIGPIISVWVAVFSRLPVLVSAYALFVASLLAFSGFVLVYFTNNKSMGNKSNRLRHPLLLSYTGLMLSIFSHVIIMVVGRSLSETAYIFSHLSRYYMISGLGAILFILGVLWLIHNLLRPGLGRFLMATMIAVMLFGGSMTQIFWNSYHVQSWDNLRNFMWQLAEIAPNLEDGTTIIVDNRLTVIEFEYITFIIGDLFYDNPSITLVVASKSTPEAMPSFSLDNGDWGFGWVSSYDQAILVYQDQLGTVHLVDPAQPVPDDFTLSDNALALLPLLPQNPSQFIITTPIENPGLRDHYFPRP